MDLSDIKDSYVRKQEIPFSSEQKWMAVKCSPKNEVSLLLGPFPPHPPLPQIEQMQTSARGVSFIASVRFQTHDSIVTTIKSLAILGLLRFFNRVPGLPRGVPVPTGKLLEMLVLALARFAHWLGH